MTIKEGDQTNTVKMGNQSNSVDMGNQSNRVKMGTVDVKVDLGSITVEAMQSITIKVGQSTVTIDQILQLEGGITMIN